MIFFAGSECTVSGRGKHYRPRWSQDKAEVFWDADEYYINDKTRKPGNLFRNYIEKWPADPVKWIENDFR